MVTPALGRAALNSFLETEPSSFLSIFLKIAPQLLLSCKLLAFATAEISALVRLPSELVSYEANSLSLYAVAVAAPTRSE